MVRKIYLIISLSIILTSNIFATQSSYTLAIEDWSVDLEYKSNSLNIDTGRLYTKKTKETTFIIPEDIRNKPLYLNVINHIGFTKIYINDNLIDTLGVTKDINSHNADKFSIRIHTNIASNNTMYDLKIENYSLKTELSTKYFISDRELIPNKINTKAKEIIPISYFLITILIIIFLNINKDLDNYRINRVFKISLILFSLYFLLSYDRAILTRVFGLASLSTLTLYYVLNHQLWSKRKRIVFLIVVTSTPLIIITLYTFGIIILYTDLIPHIFLLLLNLLLVTVVFKTKKSDEQAVRIGLIIGLILNIISVLIIGIFKQPICGITQTGLLVIIIVFYQDSVLTILKKTEQSAEYSSKLLDSMNKLKADIEKKEGAISKLKVKNHEIERGKSIFFSALSRNLRTPLNSIIGYSENLYSSEKIDEITPIVNEIIIESDKIFQAINNIMDFSSKDFTDDDLELTDFRIKDIFENTVYESQRITAFKNQINYISEKDSDKVLILGNQRIYKQILTRAFHYLLEMVPEEIEITISNSGITTEYINLTVSVKGEKLKYTDVSFDDSVKNSRDIFMKYINLYNIQLNEEIDDQSYAIDLNFQSTLSLKQIKDKKSSKHNDLILSKSLSVLVVEDYQPNLNILKMHLTKMGCEVFSAPNGDEAITIFNKEQIDLILMDIQMPIMDGWETTELIRSTDKGLNTMIIGLTASSLELDIRHCFESGMDDVQVKPIRRNQLYKKLSSFEDFKPEKFPNLASLRADYRLSKVETETLFSTSILQIEKQLEVLTMLISADDKSGVEKLIPAVLHATLNINAFYYSRLLRNFFDAYKNREKERVERLEKVLKDIIIEVKNDHAKLFRT